MKNRPFAALLAAFVLTSAVPFTAFADDGETETIVETTMKQQKKLLKRR